MFSGEEYRHGLQQRPVQPAAHRAVRGDQEHQHQRDHRDTVRADFCREIGEDERLAQRLDDQVGEKQQETVQEEQKGAATLPGHAREQRQQPLEGLSPELSVSTAPQPPPDGSLSTAVRASKHYPSAA